MKDKSTTLLETDMTPMMKQYLEIKAKHTDAILFFRLGDFYEMFYEDAEVASRELELTLTGRGSKGAKRMPMCGIPYHAADNYISRLINKGYKVAICEQVEDPALAPSADPAGRAGKGLTKREVIKIITPGTITDEKLLPSALSNYLAAVLKSELKADLYGLAYADISTGVFKTTQVFGRDNLKSELLRIEPAELLTNDKTLITELELPATLVNNLAVTAAQKVLSEQFRLSPKENQLLSENEYSLTSSAAVIQYLRQTQKNELKQLNRLDYYVPSQYMYLDTSSRKNLELTSTIRTQSKTGSLYGLLDKTKTAMGSRLLKEWINYPLLDSALIAKRLDAVEELLSDLISREELSTFLKDVYDIERLIGRIAGGNANARDLISLKESFSAISNTLPTLNKLNSPLLKKLTSPELINVQKNIRQLIEQAIVPEPPLQLKEGNILRDGYNSELDQLRQISKLGKDWVAQLETTEKQKTGIKSLKVGYTSVFGYYLEVSNSNKDLVPNYFIRKQTLTNAERYITPELKEKETDILNAVQKIEKLEYQLFSELRENIAKHIRPIQEIARAAAELDVLLSLSFAAVQQGYTRPKIISEEFSLKLVNGRHPVIETTMSKEKFIPNSCHFDQKEQHFMLLFGPNMSGKSTYMRQVALLVLMAQMGSFVPAEKLEFSLVDRLFTRVGAMDDLFSGRSTFMVEMSETANILRYATKKSLIILDEVGRGTSTYDGMAIAWALAEYIYLNTGAKTIFATHYHELAQLAGTYPGIHNFNVAVQDNSGEIIFLHKVLPGPASGSYGIHVAKLAGLPDELIERANKILGMLQSPPSITKQQLNLF